jgi:MerR family transcriptional regulator, light-induced transcriptional regulator
MTTDAPGDTDPRGRGRYNMQAVSRRTGVPAPTIRAWERRYGVPRPARSAGRQRLYSEEDVRFISWMRERTAEGMSASRAAMLWSEDHERGAAQDPLSSPQSAAELARELVAAIARHDVREAEAVLTRAFAVHDVETACTAVIQPALVEIGEGWHRGEIEVATEHLASQVIRGALSGLLRTVGYQHGERLAVVAGAPGELHDLGAQMLAIFLARRGLRVLFLGGDVPSDSLARITQQLRPDVVALSAASAETAAALAETARHLGTLPLPPRVVFGGQAFEQDASLIAAVPGVFVGDDASGGAQHIIRLLRGT